MDCAAEFGICEEALFDLSLPIRGVAGDQQAAAIGQDVCPALKSTYGTGCFVIINTGDEAVASKNRLLTTIGYRLNGTTTYALEGSIFVSGAIVQWLRDGWSARRRNRGHRGRHGRQRSYGAGADRSRAPHWAPHARGAVYGITRDTGPADFVRAALESVAYQTNDCSPPSPATAFPFRWCGRWRHDGEHG